MRKVVRVLLILILPFSGFSQEIDLFEAFFGGKYYARGGQQVDFLHTSDQYTQLVPVDGGQAIVAHDIRTGKAVAELFNSTTSEIGINVGSYRFSSDDEMILLATEEERIFRHSSRSYFYVYDRANEALFPLDLEEKQMYPLFSPDNSKVAFIKGNDLYYKDLREGKIIRVTDDGVMNKIINGRPDWVYEEEFSIERLYEWSGDGSQLVYAKFDETDVPEFKIVKTDDGYPYVESFKYPRVGETNSTVTLHAFDVKDGTNSKVPIPFDYEYIPRLTPTQNGAAFILLNREQNHLRIAEYDIADETCSLIYEEEDKRYIDLPNVFDQMASGEFLITSERDGWAHLYKVAPDKIEALTTGEFEVTQFYSLADDGWLYYQSSERHPAQRHIYRLHIEDGTKELLDEREGTHRALLAGDASHFVHTYSSVSQPPVITVRRNDGKKVRKLEDNAELKKKYKKDFAAVEFATLDLNDVEMESWMIKPQDFDPVKKYPVLVFCYGGPNGQRVTNSHPDFFGIWFQVLASKGYIVACLDNRGTSGYGADFRKNNHLTLGTTEVEDQLKFIEHLGALGYVDKDRIGMYGWSYGGYMALMTLFNGDGALKAALSAAPVTDWRLYDTVYTERYMGLPDENAEGYKKGSAIEAVRNWDGGKLFLAHGTADDNVHFQNTTDLIKAMSAYGKDYDLYIYPDGAHGMGGFQNLFHLLQRMTQFIEEEL